MIHLYVYYMEYGNVSVTELLFFMQVLPYGMFSETNYGYKTWKIYPIMINNEMKLTINLHFTKISESVSRITYWIWGVGPVVVEYDVSPISTTNNVGRVRNCINSKFSILKA